MKNIELTEDHKSKLLEMCKELFPEVRIWTGMFPDGSKAPEKVLECPMDLEWGTEWDLPYISIKKEQIHWFEFCMTHLIRKIDNLHSEKILKPLENKACKEGYPDNWLEIWNQRPWIKLWSLTNSGSYKKHPVNYLHEEFLKLK